MSVRAPPTQQLGLVTPLEVPYQPSPWVPCLLPAPPVTRPAQRTAPRLLVEDVLPGGSCPRVRPPTHCSRGATRVTRPVFAPIAERCPPGGPPSLCIHSPANEHLGRSWL